MPWEKQFDRSKVLASAEEAFWEGGYEATSMDILLGKMGIQKGSFYATFGSKHKALMESLHLYIQDRFAAFQKLAEQHKPLVALERHFDEMLEECGGNRADRGCFLVNAAVELAAHDETVSRLVRKTFDAHEEFYRKLLAAARQDGSLPEDFDVKGTAGVLLGLLVSMRVFAKAGMPLAKLRLLRDQAVASFRGGAASGGR